MDFTFRPRKSRVPADRAAPDGGPGITFMRRISAIFIAVCMVLIAGSLGAVLFLGLKLDAYLSAIAALAALTGMALYNAVSSRLRDRSDLGDQIADLSRGTADLARQVAELARRLNAAEARLGKSAERPRGALDPLAAELGELQTMVRRIAGTVASHAAALQQEGALPATPAPAAASAVESALVPNDGAVVDGRRFRGLGREGAVELIGKAVDANRIDLYLQPIVTLPQRKVRYYEALSRLRTEEGDIITAGDFIGYAESLGLMPKIDNLLLFRCVQVTRRLQMKSRDVGLFCNVGAATLSEPTFFRQFLDFADANRALSNALMFEFTQSAYRAFGPLEHESLAALAERGFRFSLDHVSDLRLEPKELAERSFRFLKVPAGLLLDPAAARQGEVPPADLADVLARAGIDLIAERIESEHVVVDLLDCDVRFGQGFLFSAPRPVRAEALQGAGGASGGLPGELAAVAASS
jgi:cyclic-di-GMP phosphodiesterase TipF (flagellum assembly factor)